MQDTGEEYLPHESRSVKLQPFSFPRVPVLSYTINMLNECKQLPKKSNCYQKLPRIALKTILVF